MIETKEFNLNGLKLKAGEITPRTRRFFESRGATIQDNGDRFRLFGAFCISKKEIDAFLAQKQQEDARAQGSKVEQVAQVSEPSSEQSSKASFGGFKIGFLNK